MLSVFYLNVASPIESKNMKGVTRDQVNLAGKEGVELKRITKPFDKPEECSFDALNYEKRCFWMRNWHLVLSGFIVPLVTIKVFCFPTREQTTEDDDAYYEAAYLND